MGYSALHAGFGDSESQRSAGSYSQRSQGGHSQPSSLDGPTMNRLKGALPKKPFLGRSASSTGSHQAESDRSYLQSVLQNVSEHEFSIKHFNQKMAQMHEALVRVTEVNTNRTLNTTPIPIVELLSSLHGRDDL